MLEHKRLINTSDLRVGSSFSEPLFFDDGQYMFLARFMPLSQQLLDSLHEWKIPFVLTCGLEILKPLDEDEFEEIPELESVG